MVEKDHPQLSVRRQCELLVVNRNRLAARHGRITEQDEKIMRAIDEIHLREPTYGTRQLRRILVRDHGLSPGRARVRRLMKLMGLHATYPQPRTSLPGKGHKKFPYLLGNLDVTRPNHVWCADITYIPMPKGFCYLVAVMDWYSRAVLGWSVSTTMDTGFCVDAWRMAVETAGRTPEIMNTDQGCQFTSQDWMEELNQHEGLQISMDGKGRWIDNVFIERLWWSVKYEDVYLKSYATPREVERGVSKWFEKYNGYRPHSAHGGKTPWSVHANLEDEQAA